MIRPSNKQEHINNEEENEFVMRLSRRFIVFSVCISCLVAFSMGHISRINIIVTLNDEFLKLFLPSEIEHFTLPNPVLQIGKIPPITTYTSKNFKTAQSTTTHSRWIVTEVAEQIADDISRKNINGISKHEESQSASIRKETEKDDEHLPAGQHLLIDIEQVDSTFLNSEERLANAMLSLIEECGLTLLSYHCHHMQPSGVSCAGVLLESHISFHTWPDKGVITLDLYTCGPTSLLPIVPLAKQLFAIPKAKTDTTESDDDDRSTLPKMVYAHKFRGFGHDDTDASELSDMLHFPVGQMSDFKIEIASVTTDFQRMDVYDVLRPGVQSLDLYTRSLLDDGSYESLHPELFAPDRIVFLDGVLQSRKSGDASYHESLVHPAMFAHKNPRRVAIVGGGEGATLREVLKHNTVEKVIMIDIDEQMVELSKKTLPFWSDCNQLMNSTDSCFDDSRVETYFLDAFKWFIDRFSEDSKIAEEERFDVIIMDALDPQIQKEFVDALYDGGPFLKSLPNALKENGILISQVGQANSIRDPSGEFSIDKNRIKFIESLVSLGFPAIRDYEESHNGFEAAWQFVAAFKDFDNKGEWFADSSLVDLKIHQRGMITKSGGSPFHFFDGVTMQSYRYPSKGSEVAFCRLRPQLEDCKNGHGFDPELRDIPLTSLEVKTSSLGENVGRGVFAKERIPQNSYIGLAKLINSIYINPNALNILIDLNKIPWVRSDFYGKQLEIYASEYGHYYSRHGETEVFVDSTFQVYINHGCVGANNIGYDMVTTEASADANNVPVEVTNPHLGNQVIYNPAKERQIRFYSSATPRRHILSGEELLDNYLGMTGMKIQDWKEDVNTLKKQCHNSGKQRI